MHFTKAKGVNCFSLSCVQKKHSVLMSVIAGEAVASLRNLDDKQVLQQCMATLRELFKEQVRDPCSPERWSQSKPLLPSERNQGSGAPLFSLP